MADLRMNREKFRNHLHYSGWKYALAAALSIAIVSILFDATRYRPPREHTVSLYLTTSYCQADAMKEELAPLLIARFPEQEELNVLNIDLSQENTYLQMQYTTYLGAGEGDALLLSTREVERLFTGNSAEDVLADLSPYAEEGLLSMPEGERFRVPAESLTGLSRWGCKTEDAWLCVLARSPNIRAAAGLIGILQEQYKSDEP
ncbi:MAG: hypothetical protein K5746_10860 [Clostridiales bacterium]|nr:hypothetical protein [Clostridiales bacterium]